MSTFAVTIETIRETRPIPGADRIEVATLAGMDFEFVIPKGRYVPGDRIVYFPVDSLLPEPLIERLGLSGKLAGAKRNRVKTVTLRGQISQGLVASLDVLPPGVADPAAITAALGVEKYEPPQELIADAVLERLPEGQGVFDIESADRFAAIAERLLEQPVFVTEKVEGANLWARAEPDGTVRVGQRQHTLGLVADAVHTFHAIARAHRMDELARELAAGKGVPIVVYGEALGPKIQGNYYGLKNHTVRLFDLKVGNAFLPATDFLAAVSRFYGDTALVVPILQPPDGTTLRTWLAGRTVKEASDGRSRLADRPREGIVVKPLVESWTEEVGRLVLKQRSPQYLAKSDL